MRPRARPWLIAGGVVCLAAVAAVPLALQYRHQLGRLIHRLHHPAGGSDSRTVSGPPIINSVVFNGIEYRDVLGYPPYYLEVPELDSVLFVTRLTSSGTNVLHVLNRKTGADIQIPTIADFGRSIGLTNGAFLEYIERVDPGKLSVASESGFGILKKTVFKLNLQTARMDGRDIYYYDSNGKITNSTHAPGF